jgi:methylthioribose-1-phosphate isomerase
MEYHTLQWHSGCLRLLDQRKLPHEVTYIDYTEAREVAGAIRDMVVRGAPAIGATAAYGLALAAVSSQASTCEGMRVELEKAGQMLKAARPTAVNLAWAVDRVLGSLNAQKINDPADLQAAVLAEANRIFEEDIETNKQTGLNALPLIPDNAVFIHHCNTGALATVDYGTALGVIRTAHEHGRHPFVYVDETRPRLQGARLTAWELDQLGIPYQIIVDGASGHVMRTKHVDLCTVGCDRVAANGDTANKVGTFNLALAAYAHHVPFYVVGPTSTVDLNTPNGDAIPVEERAAEEVTHIGCEHIAPEGAHVFNPAFDVTPAKYITAIITEKGIARPPYEISLAAMKQK